MDNHSATPQAATLAHFHLHCLAHIINLVVKDCLKISGATVNQLLDSIHWIHGSSSQMDSFEKALTSIGINFKKKNPCKDFPTQWNSMYLMIKAYLP